MTLRLLPSTMKWLNRPGREAGAAGRCGHRPLGKDGFTPTSSAVFASRSRCCSAHRSEKSRKLDLYDVEIQLPTNPKWTVAPYRREEGRRSCVGWYGPVGSGLGCVLF